MNYLYEHDGQTHTVSLEALPGGAFRATVEGRIFDVQARPAGDGGWLLEMDGQRVTIYTAAAGDARFVHADGQTWTLNIPAPRSKRRGTASGGGDLTAQMPGQVTGVFVKDGEAVMRGQVLVILEAMKMEIRASAPADGVVSRVLVAQGDVVERGQRLVEIITG